MHYGERRGGVLGQCSAHHLATLIGYHQTTFKDMQVIFMRTYFLNTVLQE